jgi:ketosteroid isomerase-like protein
VKKIKWISVGFIMLIQACMNQPIPVKETKSIYIPVSQNLYNTIQLQDSLLFAAFNEHNSSKLMSYFSEDLEFYHDKGGLSDYAGTTTGFESLFKNNQTTGLRREIVPGSLEVYPINDYGAIETCLHQFCHKEKGKDDCGTFKNTMIWKKTDTGWKVTRVISYDH